MDQFYWLLHIVVTAMILTAEALSLLDAYNMLAHFKIKEAIFEVDSLNAISFIKNASNISF